jgi:hypothetical protein
MPQRHGAPEVHPSQPSSPSHERAFAWWKVWYFAAMFVLLGATLAAFYLVAMMLFGWDPVLG